MAAMCFARAGDFARARAAATEGTEQAARLSPHRRLHAAMAGALARVPCGALDELRTATTGVTELVTADVCSTGVVGLAGRVLALFEAHDPATAEAIALLERVAPPARPLGGWGHTIVEFVRPAIGLEAARERLDALGPVSDISALRAEIPVRALSGEHERLRALVDQARARAGPACALDLAAFADRGQAVLNRDRDLARRAAAALDARGEHYTAARLLADLGAGEPARLAAMGAHATAELCGFVERVE